MEKQEQGTETRSQCFLVGNEINNEFSINKSCNHQ